MNLKDRIIVALDVRELDEMKTWVEELSPFVGCFKVGLELITSVGAPAVVNWIHQAGGSVFLDGKFHDIPHTVRAASEAAAALGVKMFNVHASAGREALQHAHQVKKNSLLLAVTVLTSTNEETCQHIYHSSIPSQVTALAQDAKACGVDGLICSAEDLKFLNPHPELQSLLKITPGIRPAWADQNDQKRSLTPREALLAGATAMVIGRPITQPPRAIGSRREAAQRVLDEMAGVL